jgi:threonine/homoserine/homoserine lactone efflux protein
VAVLSAEALLLLALLTLIPGPDTFLTLRQSLVGGVRLALPTIAGTCTGTVIHATISGAGLALLLQNSPAAFRVVQYAGVAYLAYLGVRSLWSARKPPPVVLDGPVAVPRTLFGGYRDGLFTNLLNPKVALFYLGFLPQFIPAGPAFLATSILYGLCHAAMGQVQLGTVALAAHWLRTRVTSPRFRQGTEAVAGAAFLLFSLRLAFLSN